MNETVRNIINELEKMSKQGEAYDNLGEHGWRNPVRADTGFILHSLILARNPNYVLEIGTAYGLSGCYIASALKPRAMMVTIEFDPEVAQQAQKLFSEAHLPVTVLPGDAIQVIDSIEERKVFDCVFLDANKDGYLKQIKRLQDRGLLAYNCLVIADNVIDRKDEMQDFLTWMKQYPHITIPTECGLLVGRLGSDY